ncbi:3590_t:CDS:2, partial [Entrophospora sp. SA101]
TANDINNEYSLPTLEHKIKNEKELDPRLQYTAQYLRLVNSGYKKMDASNIIAQSLNRGTWCARLIRTWGKQYSKNGELIASKKGKHQKVKSIIYDEDIRLKISEYLRVNKFEVTIKKFQQFVTDEILLDLGIENKISISDSSARRWLIQMGFSLGGSMMVSDYLCETIGRLKLDSAHIQINSDLPPGQQIPKRSL